jgi:hypothetical protein
VAADRPPLRDELAQELIELQRLGHQYQVQASQLLRSGRPGWEAWFEAGLELKRAAERLQAVTSQTVGRSSPITRQPVVRQHTSPQGTVSRYPYARRS